MPIIGINNDIVSSNFVSSDLIDDTGIATPNDTIKSLCAATADYQLFVQLVNKMTLNETIDSHNFFDQFCINKALIKIIKNHLRSISSVDHDYDTIIYRGYNSMCSIQLDVPFNRFKEATKMIYDDGHLIGPNSSEWSQIKMDATSNSIVHENHGTYRHILLTFGSNNKVTFIRDHYPRAIKTSDYVYNVCAYEKRNM